MATLEIDQTWTFDSTGVGTAINCLGAATQMACWGVTSGASSGAFQIESSPNSTGPWATEGSTTLSTGSCAVLRFNGPVLWVRPYVTELSTIGITVRLVGVS